jgi:glyoxylase-like metal-dependent hydrolase (beta-lactamase superfamily II)
MVPYTKGLHQIADGVWAWLAPDGSWGWSNAGLIEGDGRTMLVDTLFDLKLTGEMLDAMAPIMQRSPLSDVLNTHANGDHCYGNQLLPQGVRIHAAPEVAHEMHEQPAALLAQLTSSDLGPVLTPFIRKCFGPFDFEGITVREPNMPVHGSPTVSLGDRRVELVTLGPAHTQGDVVAHVVDAGVVFAGDLLFISGTPIMWAGPVENWIAACDTMMSWNPLVVVPGHGPVTDVDGIREVRDYFTHVDEQVRSAYEAGKDWKQAAWEIDLDRFAGLRDAERVVVTTHQIYRSLDPEMAELDVGQLFLHMAEWELAHRSRS